MMITIPQPIAKMIVLDQMHPVAAWRQYYGMSKDTLANYLQTRTDEVTQIETSNQHLRPDNLNKLCKVFNIYPQALTIRYNHITNPSRSYYAKNQTHSG